MLRISLRQLFVLVALVALAIVSLKYASFFWQGVIGLLAMFALFAAAMLAIFERGPRRAFGIGCLLVMLSYAIAVLSGGPPPPGFPNMPQNPELDSQYGRLPTTHLLRTLHALLAERHWYDPNTGELVPDFDPSEHISVTMGPPVQRAVLPQYTPSSELFTPVGHYWWAIVLGYLGGCFARFVNVRRMKETAAQLKE